MHSEGDSEGYGLTHKYLQVVFGGFPSIQWFPGLKYAQCFDGDSDGISEMKDVGGNHRYSPYSNIFLIAICPSVCRSITTVRYITHVVHNQLFLRALPTHRRPRRVTHIGHTWVRYFIVFPPVVPHKCVQPKQKGQWKGKKTINEHEEFTVSYER